MKLSKSLDTESIKNNLKDKEVGVAVAIFLISFFLFAIFVLPNILSFPSKKADRDTEIAKLNQMKAATKEFENLQKNTFGKYKVALLHGKLKSKEKEEVLNNFKNRKFDILVATPVVEVGIDIPNADIILIEAAERFGLSQLHQLRGRVGRNDKQAYCLLFTESQTPQTLERLRAMEKTNVGSQLAELDLKMRGPGEIYGTRQSGRSYLKVASFSDFELIQTTKKEAERVAPVLNKYPKLKQKIEEISTKEISPD